jgi:hypothetical protein
MAEGDRMTKVFVSTGTPYTEAQEKFVSALERQLASHGLKPHTVGRNSFSAKQPVMHARSLMRECHGAVVVAFTRVLVKDAEEYPSTPQAVPLKEVRHPTVWNQLEGALAFGFELPLLILVEKGVKREAMLSDRSEWFPIETDLSETFITSERFQAVLKDWVGLVNARATTPRAPEAPPPKDLSRLTASDFFSSLTVAQMWGIGAAAVGLLAGVAVLAFWLGKTFG